MQTESRFRKFDVLHFAPMIALCLCTFSDFAWAFSKKKPSIRYPESQRPVDRSAYQTWAEYLEQQETVAYLNHLTKSQVTKNKVTLLDRGVESWPVRQRVIQEAQNYIFMAVPYWFNDVKGNETLELIRNKSLNTDVDLKVTLDWSSAGSTGDFFGADFQQKLFQAFRKELLLWNPPWWTKLWSVDLLRNRMHDKMIVSDGLRLLMGGMNIADEYLLGGVDRKGWHDTDILIEGKGAQEATRIYLKLWLLNKHLLNPLNPFPVFLEDAVQVFNDYFYEEDESALDKLGAVDLETRIKLTDYTNDAKYFPELPDSKENDTPVRLIYDNPLFDRNPKNAKHFSRLMTTLDFLFDQSNISIRIFVPYLTITDRFSEMLVRAAKRGVQVDLITNSLISHDLGTVAYFGGVARYAPLLQAGVRIHEWQGHQPLFDLEKQHDCEIDDYWPGHTLHTKVLVLDDEVTLIGSHNLNVRSESYNNELTAMIVDREVTANMLRIFDRALDSSEVADTIACGERQVERPRKTREVSKEKLEELIKKHGFDIDFWKNFGIYM